MSSKEARLQRTHFSLRDNLSELQKTEFDKGARREMTITPNNIFTVVFDNTLPEPFVIDAIVEPIESLDEPWVNSPAFQLRRVRSHGWRGPYYMRVSAWRQIETEVARLTFIWSCMKANAHAAAVEARRITAHIEQFGLGREIASTIWKNRPPAVADKPLFDGSRHIKSRRWASHSTLVINDQPVTFDVALRLSGLGQTAKAARQQEKELVAAYNRGIDSLLDTLLTSKAARPKWL